MSEGLHHCEAACRSVFPSERTAKLASDIAIYLAHVETGVPMREIAREKGQHPSTIMRAVRRVETLRDDPLLDRALVALKADISGESSGQLPAKECEVSVTEAKTRMTHADRAVLRKLCEPEAFLMVATGADKAGVFCRKNQFRRPLAMVELDKAMTFLRRDWISCYSKTDLSAKYRATSAGKAALKRAMAAEKQAEPGFAEAAGVFTDQHQLRGARRIANIKTGEIETVRVNLGESPLGWLARRKGPDGSPLLSPEEVEAGERLREDFELAQIGPKVGQDWRRFLAGGDKPTGGGRTPSEGPLFARERVENALEALGPGLSDAALRVCCFLEGLEATERRMGWSARSGKVVLKLALQRLVDHYGLAEKQAA